jgi:hypothetical protein
VLLSTAAAVVVVVVVFVAFALECFPSSAFTVYSRRFLSFAVGEVPPSLLPHLSLSLFERTYLAHRLAGRHFTHLFMCNLLG